MKFRITLAALFKSAEDSYLKRGLLLKDLCEEKHCRNEETPLVVIFQVMNV